MTTCPTTHCTDAMIRRYLSGSVTNNVDVQAILRDGFVRFPNSVESRLCESVLRTAMEDFETESKTWQYKLSRIFDIVNTPKNRHSIKLKMSDDVKALLGETLYGDARRNRSTKDCTVPTLAWFALH